MLTDSEGQRLRWLAPQIDALLRQLEPEAAELRPHAGLKKLPGAVADVGWVVYRRALRLSSLPVRLTSRDPGVRLRRTVQSLLRFPFRPAGPPGYAARVRVTKGASFTHFTLCPPYAAAKRIAEAEYDRLVVDAFRQSWCTYDRDGGRPDRR